MNRQVPFVLDGEVAQQFGAIREFARTRPRKELIEGSALWVLSDVARVCSDLGIEVSDILPNLGIFYSHGITPANAGDHGDPLGPSSVTRRVAPAIEATVIVGWKFMAVFVGDAPTHETALVEGEAPRSNRT